MEGVLITITCHVSHASHASCTQKRHVSQYRSISQRSSQTHTHTHTRYSRVRPRPIYRHHASMQGRLEALFDEPSTRAGCMTFYTTALIYLREHSTYRFPGISGDIIRTPLGEEIEMGRKSRCRALEAKRHLTTRCSEMNKKRAIWNFASVLFTHLG
jgi:hypothetical protein